MGTDGKETGVYQKDKAQQHTENGPKQVGVPVGILEFVVQLGVIQRLGCENGIVLVFHNANLRD